MLRINWVYCKHFESERNIDEKAMYLLCSINLEKQSVFDNKVEQLITIHILIGN